ncbi:uncharacterized protein METZ01_LOCUS326560 [marine metagenome]|uniref:Uncharacterized protein n=1 Tax=marine metagenome TaxID=408172 RepID=A0A382PKC3_9ZZZZ
MGVLSKESRSAGGIQERKLIGSCFARLQDRKNIVKDPINPSMINMAAPPSVYIIVYSSNLVVEPLVGFGNLILINRTGVNLGIQK